MDRHDFLKTLAEACQKTGWQVHVYCLMRSKSDPDKLAIPTRLRRETTLPIREIAARVQLGWSKSANARLHEWVRQSQPQQLANSQQRNEI
jgi:hypothetical protein